MTAAVAAAGGFVAGAVFAALILRRGRTLRVRLEVDATDDRQSPGRRRDSDEREKRRHGERDAPERHNKP